MSDQRLKGDKNGKDYGQLLSESPQTVKDEGQLAPQSTGTVVKTHDVTSRDVTKADGVPYDRGWAWMILLGTFTNVTILTGYIRSTGILFVELLRHFGAPASQTSLIFGIRSAVFSISGLYVMNVVVGRLGSRKTVIIGSFCVSLSLILSSIAGDLITLICVQSILLGVGIAMLVAPGEVLVGVYFKRRRSLALALGKCGASVGSFAVPPLVVYLLQEYGLRGALLVYGAICFHSLPAALLLRPTSFYKKLQQRRGREGIGEKEDELDVTGAVEGDNTGLTKCFVSHIEDDRREVVQVNQRAGETSASSSTSNIVISLETSFDGVTACKAENNSETGKFRDLAGLAKSLPEIQVLHRGEELVSTSRKRTFSEPTKVDIAAQKQTRDLKTSGVIEKASESPIAKYISMPSLEFGSMPVIDLRHTMTNYTVHEISEKDAKEEENLIARESRGRTTSDRRPTIQEGRVVQCCKSALSVLDFTLLRRPTFRMLLVYFAFSPVVNIITNLLPAVAIEKGVGKTEAALLLSVNGGLDLVCRLGTGFLADSKKLQVSTLIVIAVVLSIMTQFVRFMTSFVHFLLLAVVHGLVGGVSNVLGPILIIEYTGLENLSKGLGQRFSTFYLWRPPDEQRTAGLGFAQFMVGASMAGVYPLLGYIRDVTGSYDVTYHVIGCGILLAAGLLLLVRLVHRWETRHQKKMEQDNKKEVVC